MGIIQSIVSTPRPSREDFEKRLASDRDFLESYIKFLEGPCLVASPTPPRLPFMPIAAGVQPVMSVQSCVPEKYFVEEFNSHDERVRRIAALKARIATF